MRVGQQLCTALPSLQLRAAALAGPLETTNGGCFSLLRQGSQVSGKSGCQFIEWCADACVEEDCVMKARKKRGGENGIWAEEGGHLRGLFSSLVLFSSY